MPTHNRDLIEIINDKAKATWIDTVDPVKDPYEWNKAWEQHWLSTAKEWRDKLVKENSAALTVKGLDKIISYFEGLINERTGQSRDASNPKVDG